MCQVDGALEKARVDKFTFNKWCECACSAFIEHNLTAIPDFTPYGGNNKRIKLDPRCFIDHMNSIASLAQSNHHVIQQLRRQLTDMQEIMTHYLTSTHKHLHETRSVVESVQRIDRHLLGKRPIPVSPQPSFDVTKFTVSSKGITNQMSVSDIFVSFFYEDYRSGFEVDKKSEAWKEDMDVPKLQKPVFQDQARRLDGPDAR